jgi:flagellar motility protein MotE (MotC chaperone)
VKPFNVQALLSTFAVGRRDVRLLPVVMVTATLVLGLKAVALAETATDHAEPAPAASTAPAPAAAAAPAKPAAGECPAPSFAEQAGLSATEVDVLQSLGARRTQLDQRAADMSTQGELLNATEKRVNERLEELKRLQASVEGLLGKLNEEQDARINGLVTVYSKMKPKDAARIFEGLDDNVLLEVASRMKQTNLSEIMGLMNAESARKLTKNLMEQRKPPENMLQRANAGAPIPAVAAPKAG